VLLMAGSSSTSPGTWPSPGGHRPRDAKRGICWSCGSMIGRTLDGGWAIQSAIGRRTNELVCPDRPGNCGASTVRRASTRFFHTRRQAMRNPLTDTFERKYELHKSRRCGEAVGGDARARCPDNWINACFAPCARQSDASWPPSSVYF